MTAKLRLNALATGPPAIAFTWCASEGKSGPSPRKRFVASISDLALESTHLAEGAGDRTRRHGDQDHVCCRDVTAVLAQLMHLVASGPPKPGQPAADVSPADNRDVHAWKNRRRPGRGRRKQERERLRGSTSSGSPPAFAVLRYGPDGLPSRQRSGDLTTGTVTFLITEHSQIRPMKLASSSTAKISENAFSHKPQLQWIAGELKMIKTALESRSAG
jgi:hypothetical protein